MFHPKLIELEAELLAKEESLQGVSDFSAECRLLFETIEAEIGCKLADRVVKQWHSWLTYRQHKKSPNESLVICRGKAFPESSFFGFKTFHAGLEVGYGYDTVTEYRRGFDVTPPQDLDHLLINFGDSKSTRVFLWYGENIAAYKLIYEADITQDPHDELKEAVAEACVWILTRPKEKTLSEFLKEKESEKNA